MRRFIPLAHLKFGLLLVAGLLLASAARAGRVEDLIRIHLEAIGGKERVAALKALKATGYVAASGKKMKFTMYAARPDRIRVETESAGRTLVQASNGKDPAWEFDTGEWPPRYHDMQAAHAKTFTADAEFDDPLVGGAARGYTFEYGGEVPGDGKKLIRILVTRRLSETFSILLDPDTLFIVRRLEERRSKLGGRSFVVTQFSDFRPVEGVLLPHQVLLAVDGNVKQEMLISAIQANPEMSPDTFTRPKAGTRK